jgi:hypothetical protein
LFGHTLVSTDMQGTVALHALATDRSHVAWLE